MGWIIRKYIYTLYIEYVVTRPLQGAEMLDCILTALALLEIEYTSKLGRFEVGAPKKTQKKQKEKRNKKIQYIQVDTNLMMRCVSL